MSQYYWVQLKVVCRFSGWWNPTVRKTNKSSVHWKQVWSEFWQKNPSLTWSPRRLIITPASLCPLQSPCFVPSPPATADAGQHIWRVFPQRAAWPAAAPPRRAGEAAAEEGQQPRGGEEPADQRYGSLQAEDREHAQRTGREDQWAGERYWATSSVSMWAWWSKKYQTISYLNHSQHIPLPLIITLLKEAWSGYSLS